jgi:hypothetical protein
LEAKESHAADIRTNKIGSDGTIIEAKAGRGGGGFGSANLQV